MQWFDEEGFSQDMKRGSETLSVHVVCAVEQINSGVLASRFPRSLSEVAKGTPEPSGWFQRAS